MKIWFANVIALVKMYLQTSTSLQVTLWHTTILHEHSTGLTVVKTCITIRYRCSTGFAVVKMYLPNIYKLSTGSAVVKSGRPSTGIQTGSVVLKTRVMIHCRH